MFCSNLESPRIKVSRDFHCRSLRICRDLHQKREYKKSDRVVEQTLGRHLSQVSSPDFNKRSPPSKQKTWTAIERAYARWSLVLECDYDHG